MIPLRDDNPTSIVPYLTIGFIVACVLIFFWQISLDPSGQKLVVYGLGVIPAALFNHAQLPPELYLAPASLTVFTSMFLHGGWMHLIGNMLYLWIFGNNVEDAMGHFKFILFYFLCGVAAVFAQALPNTSSEIPMIGASGAISGILGAYLLLHPHARVLVLIPLGFFSQLIHIKAGWVLGIWFGLQLFSTLSTGGNAGGIAFGAHIGGFIAGMILVPIFRNKDVPIVNPFSRFRY